MEWVEEKRTQEQLERIDHLLEHLVKLTKEQNKILRHSLEPRFYHAPSHITVSSGPN